jgi:hypothetical protein
MIFRAIELGLLHHLIVAGGEVVSFAETVVRENVE